MHDGLPFSKPKVRLLGSPGEAQAYLGEAYNLLYKVRAFCESSGAPVFAMSRNMADGAVVTAAVIGDEHIVSCTPPPPRAEPDQRKPDELPGAVRGGFIFAPQSQVGYDDVFFSVVTYKGASTVWRTPGDDDSTDFRLRTQLVAKPVTWWGVRESGAEAILTWDHGMASRYRLYPSQSCSGRFIGYEFGEPTFANAGKPGVCLWGREYPTVFTGADGYVRSMNVVGAGIFADQIVFVSHTDTAWRPDPGATLDDNRVSLALASYGVASVFIMPVGRPAKLLGAFNFGHALHHPWFFSPDGSKAVSLRDVSPSNQQLLHLTFSLDAEGEVAVAFSSEALTTEAPYLDTLQDPDVDSSRESDKWIDHGPFITEIGGYVQYTINNGREWVYQEVPWASGALGGVSGVADQLDSLMMADDRRLDPWDRDEPYYRVDRQAALANNLAAAEADLSDGDVLRSDGIELWTGNPLIGWVQTKRGWAAVRGWRDTERWVWDSQSEHTYPRAVRGKFYLGVDYGFDGQVHKVSVELVGDSNLDHKTFVADRLRFYYRREGFVGNSVPFFTTLFRDTLQECHVSGRTHWVLKVDDDELFRISGGAHGTYSRYRHYARVDDTNDPLQPLGDVTVTYSHDPVPISTQRCWLIDIDARSKSCIYETETLDYTPSEPVDTGLGVTDLGVMQRYLGSGKRTPALHVLHNGALVKKFEFESRGGGLDLWARSFNMQLLPRFFDKSDNLEETHLLSYMTWGGGFDTYAAVRYYHLTPFDLMPRVLQIGQLQVRTQNHAAVSTSDATTIRTVGLLEDDALRDPTYYAAAFIPDEVDVSAQVAQRLADDEDYADPDEPVRLFPVRAL